MALEGATVNETDEGGNSVIVACPLCEVPVRLVTDTVTFSSDVIVAGAVYSPEELIVPAFAGLIVQPAQAPRDGAENC